MAAKSTTRDVEIGHMVTWILLGSCMGVLGVETSKCLSQVHLGEVLFRGSTEDGSDPTHGNDNW